MKNWNNLSDDELDKLFRQTADESNIEFEEGAWNKMEGLLNEKKPLSTKSIWKRNALVALALLFMISTSLYFGRNYFFNKSDRNITADNSAANNGKNKNSENPYLVNETTNPSSEIEKSNKSDENINNKTRTNESNINEKNSINKISSTFKETESVSEKNNTNKIIEKTGELNNNPTNLNGQKAATPKLAKSRILEDKNFESNDKKTPIDNKNKVENKNPEIALSQGFANDNVIEVNTKANIKKTKKTEKSIYNSGNITEAFFPKNTKKGNQIKEGKSENGSNFNNSISSIVGKSEKNTSIKFDQNQIVIDKGELNSLSKTELNAETAKTELQQMIFSSINSKQFTFAKPQFNIMVEALNLPLPVAKPEPFFKKGLSLRVGISPDISKVGSNAIHKIGSNMGGFLEYRFNKRLVFQAGIFRSMKYYDAYPEQYTWIWGKPASKLVEIEAICKMIDYPVNIRYDILANTKSRIFGSLGITTYKMMKETYNYDYEDNSNPNIRWRQWNGKTGSYYNSNLNISVGFEKQISKTLTIQVEPFAKAPLKSIGFGNVPLISYGMMFSANYPLRNLFKDK